MINIARKYIIPSLFIALLFGACDQNKKGESNTAIIAGKIEKPSADNIIFFHKVAFTSVNDTAQLDANGNFKISIPLTQEHLWEFKHGHEYSTLYLKPGDSLYMTLRTDSFDESIHFSGIGAEVNNYLVDYFMYKEKHEVNNEANATELKNILDKNLSEFAEANKMNVSEAFLKMQKERISYDWAIGEINPENESYLQSLDFNDTSVLGTREFDFFLRNYFGKYENFIYKSDTILYKDAAKRSEKLLEKAQQIFKDKLLYDYVLSYLMEQQIKYEGVEGMENLMQTYNQECKNVTYKKYVQEKFDAWKKLSKGNEAPGFTFEDVNGKQVSLSDFKGKYVYIDVWATWCAPCRKEIPYMQKLEYEYRNEKGRDYIVSSDVIFIKVSVDDNKQEWLNFVKENKLEGIQLWAGGWNSTINKDYIINSIPRFILIDKKGEIIDVNTPRPSGNIRELFKEVGIYCIMAIE